MPHYSDRLRYDHRLARFILRPVKTLLKVLLTLVLLAVIAAVAATFYMGRRAYELSNTVVLPAPYEINPEIIEFHEDMFVADMHADTFTFVNTFMQRKDYAHLDYERAREGGFDLLTMAIATEVPVDMVRGPDDGVERGGNLITFGAVVGLEPLANWFSNYSRGLWVVNNVTQTAADNPDDLLLITRRADLATLLTEHAAGNSGRLGLLLAVEGAHVLDGEPDRIDVLYAQGIRMLSLTHAFDNAYGGSSEGVEKYGITPAGEALLERAEELGIIIDVAHASPALVNDVLDRVTSPVVYSHGSVRGMCDIDRNLPDELLTKVQANGGLIAIGFWDRILCGDSVADIAANMRFVADRIGSQHLAIGSDFDGGVNTVFDATGLPQLTDALFDAGFSDLEIRAIMGGNYVQLLLNALPDRATAAD
jgi:membrane dipeptidase